MGPAVGYDSSLNLGGGAELDYSGHGIVDHMAPCAEDTHKVLFAELLHLVASGVEAVEVPQAVVVFNIALDGRESVIPGFVIGLIFLHGHPDIDVVMGTVVEYIRIAVFPEVIYLCLYVPGGVAGVA